MVRTKAVWYTQDGNITEVFTPHFDPHIHGRRDKVKAKLLTEASKRMCGGCFEPNTAPHILTCEDLATYLEEASEMAPHRRWSGSIYLTPETRLSEVVQAWEWNILSHVKSYPPHGTTHSDESVPPEMLLDINSSVGKLLCGMADNGIPFKTHGEVVALNGKDVHPQHREGLWYREVQPRFDELYKARGLRQIHAHITTSEAAQYALAHGDPEDCVFELTCHHLIESWLLQYDGGHLMPDHHWLPVSKDEQNTEDLRDLVRKQLPYIHAASDMAGHDTRRKYAAKAFGGGYTYHCSLELYVEVLVMLGVIGFAGDFLYGNAKQFHGSLVPNNPQIFHLVADEWSVDERTKYDGGEMTPFGYDDDETKRRKFKFKLVP